MKLVITPAVIASCILVIFSFPGQRISLVHSEHEEILSKKKNAIGCTPDWSVFKLTREDIDKIQPLPGTGKHEWRINTLNDSAQFYFNQGINLYYGFHIIESLASFKKAQQFDSTCAMLFWAEALAYGPNINDIGYAASPAALTATGKANSFSVSANGVEKALIEAMQARYSKDSSISRQKLNEEYVAAMKKAFDRFTTNPEVTTLYADALMLLHPWDLWEHNGKAKPWTNHIVSVLEKALRLEPNHPGANHYYIHAVEASPMPEKALPHANRLGKITPGMSHMVHMPSHIYIRTGNYTKGIEVNKLAVEQYKKYLQLYPDVATNAPLYDFHNRHMEATCAMNGSNYGEALRSAIDCRNSIDTSFLAWEAPLGGYIQFVYMTPVFTMITFKKWDAIFKLEPVEHRHHYAALLDEFAKGLAYANTKRFPEANESLNRINDLINEPDLEVPFGPFNAPKVGATIAKHLLIATIAEKEGMTKDAIHHYSEAVRIEDAMIYNEPKDWILPARHFLANALLRARKYTEAEKVFRQDLKYNPNNVTSKSGLVAVKNKRSNK